MCNQAVSLVAAEMERRGITTVVSSARENDIGRDGGIMAGALN